MCDIDFFSRLDTNTLVVFSNEITRILATRTAEPDTDNSSSDDDEKESLYMRGCKDKSCSCKYYKRSAKDCPNISTLKLVVDGINKNATYEESRDEIITFLEKHKLKSRGIFIKEGSALAFITFYTHKATAAAQAAFEADNRKANLKRLM